MGRDHVDELVDGFVGDLRSATTLTDSSARGSGIFVIVGSEGTILTSSDGISWEKSITGISQSLFGITYGNELFVTISEKRIILTSSDGISWTQRDSGTSETLFGITYSK